ncbi:autolysin [Bacillus paralicheniformis]|nr:autolysin [Bacillus paralicheniformis]
MNQMYVQDRFTGQKYEIADATPRVTDGVDGKKSLGFTLENSFSDPLAFNALTGRNLIVIDERVFKNQKYVIRNVQISQDGELLSKSISANHIYVFLLGKNRVDDVITGEISLDKALNHALKGSNFTYEIMADARDIKPVKTDSFGDAFSIDLMDSIASNYKVEFDVDNSHIYVYKKMGRRINKTLDTRANIQGLQIQISEDNTATRGRGYGKQKEEKDMLGDESIGYEAKTGSWTYDESLKADKTSKIGSAFTFSFTGTGFRFKTLTSKLGGKWEFVIDKDTTKTISVYKDNDPKEEVIEVVRGLDHKKHHVVATFKSKDSKNPNTKGTKGAAPVMYLLRGNIIEIYREFKNEAEKYVFPPVLFVHPNEKDFLIEGQPTWAETIRDESITKAEDMKALLKQKVNPFPEVTVDIDFEEIEVPELKGIEDKITKGDTLHVIADTPQNGITFEDDLRAVSMVYNPLDDTEKPEVTFSNFKKDLIDIQLDSRRRIKKQERYLIEQKNQILAQIQAAKAELFNVVNSTQGKIPGNFTYTLTFNSGVWAVTSGLGNVSVSSTGLLLETDDDFQIKYVTSESSTVMKQNNVSASVDYEGSQTDSFTVSLLQNGKLLDPSNAPEGSKITILIVGYS